ncbi:MAG TPA: NUDIX hydrolase [Dermatophilaceae bacterium]|nr:NUDIX hydrolase [Dermatophilaceae bacterium]
MVRDFPVGGRSDRARAWLAAGGSTAVAPGAADAAAPGAADAVAPGAAPAATVLLLRDTARGVEVFTMRRVASMDFAAGMTVFPGGRVDPADFDVAVPWAGPSVAEWSRRLGVEPGLARAVVVAAVRELFEECGVLLAGDPVADVAAPLWRAERAALLARATGLGELLRRHRLVLRSDLLSARARWVTPQFESRRYDTWFFAALLPAGQGADDASPETDQAGWTSPTQVLADHASGRVELLPPTVVAMESVAAATSARSFLASAAVVQPVLPWLAEDGADLVIRCELPV